MSISDGNDVDAATTNAAFMSRTTDTSTTGKVDLNDTGSAAITDIQDKINLNTTHRGVVTGNPHAVDIDDVTPTTTKGDLIVENGTNAVREPIGSNDEVLVADNATGTGVDWKTVESLLAATTKGDVLVHNGTNLVRLAVGANTEVLTANSAVSEGVEWAPSGAGADNSKEVYLLENGTIAAAVSANALTIDLRTLAGADASASDKIRIGFRSAADSSGVGFVREVTAALDITIPSGATMGHVANDDEYIYVYALDNSGPVELAVSTTPFDETVPQDTTVLDAASDDRFTLYSTVARISKAIKLVGRLTTVEVTPGTWATAPDVNTPAVTGLQLLYEDEIRLTSGNGHGSPNTAIRRYSTIAKEVGSAMSLTQSATDGDSITINTRGEYAVYYTDLRSDAAFTGGVTLNSPSLTTSISSQLESDVLLITQQATNLATTVSGVFNLKVGDVLRAHTDAGPNETNALRSRFRVKRIR